MTPDLALSFLRHLLTGAGTALVTKGVVDEATMTSLVGGILAAVSLAWMAVTRKKAA